VLTVLQARDEKSLREAKAVADQYISFAANKSKELEGLLRQVNLLPIQMLPFLSFSE